MSERNPVQLTLPGRDGAPPVTRTVYTSYIYCGICGHRPGANDEPNYGPIRWWDPDDGWKVGTLCRHCAADAVHDKPEAGDYAWRGDGSEIIGVENTDEDIIFALDY